MSSIDTSGASCPPSEPPARRLATVSGQPAWAPVAKQGLYDPRAEHDACGVGFVVHMKGKRSHDIVDKALRVLINLEHRGACGCEANTGDGAGILLQMPHAFFRGVVPFSLPDDGSYGAGLVFLPHDTGDRQARQGADRPHHRGGGPAAVGLARRAHRRLAGRAERARGRALVRAGVHRRRGRHRGRRREPALRAQALRDPEARREGDRDAEDQRLAKRTFYIVSLSSRRLIYKGMLTAQQLRPMFPDLSDPRLDSALALVHQRFSTNTFPSWPLAHPYRLIAHNGEINTLRGNINWMRAREGLLKSQVLGDDLKKVLPVIKEGGSDTATFDNVLELLMMAGRSLPHAVLMMIPEPWSGNDLMAADRKAFYEYHSSLMEPWDGPASIAFTDGTVIGAVLDRNGLRPSRYYVTKDDLVVMASEVGVLDIPADEVLEKGRLSPGRIFLVDTSKGRIVGDDEIKRELAAERPYREWIDAHMVDIESLPAARAEKPEPATVFARQQSFGYTQEDLRFLIGPMAQSGEEPIGSMGTDSALAVLSDRPARAVRLLQAALRAGDQPAARRDPRGAGDVDGLDHRPGAQPARARARGLPADPHQVPDHPQRARGEAAPPAAEAAVPLHDAHDAVRPGDGGRGAREGDGRAVPQGQRRREGRLRHPDPVGPRRRRAIWRRSRACWPRPACTITWCARARAPDARWWSNPATRARCTTCRCCSATARAWSTRMWRSRLSTIMIRQGHITGVARDTAIEHYIKALNKGVLKVMSKMGISTLQSYCGAQIFEAIGLSQTFIDRYFTHTMSRVGGVGIDVIAEEVRLRHERAFGRQPVRPQELEAGGEYQWRRDGEYHLFNPDTVFKLQHATRTGRYSIFKQYTQAVDDQNQHRATLRGLFRFKPAGPAVPIEEVELGRGDRQAVRHGRDVLRVDQPGGARDAGDCDEPPRRPIEYRRRRRRCRAVPADGQRRLQAQLDQAGGVGPVRRDQRVPGQRRRAADQDGAGRQAGRGRSAAGPQGLPVDREDAALDARRRADLAAAAPRHLFDRGSGAAHLRPEELEPRGAHLGEARGRRRRRHGRGRRGQGALGRRADLGPRRRHGRVALDEPQACGPAVGAGPRGNAAGARAQQAARPHRRAGGRPDEDRARRGDRRAARRRGVRLRHGAAGRHGLHHDARLPPEHLPGGHRDAGPGAAQEVHGLARVRRRTSSGSSPRKCAS